MAVALWLPWADVRCSQIQTSPTYWQLADYDHRLYVMAALVAVVAIAVLVHWIRRCRIAAACAVFGALAAVIAWCYLWLKRDELAQYQAELSSGGGDLTRIFQDLQVAVGSGFKLYLAGALVALAGAVLSWAGTKRSESSPETG